MAACIGFCATASAQHEVPDAFPGFWYRIAVDAAGNMVEGDGHGYNGGTWYYYPETGWYRQWFYNGPYDPARRGELEYKAYIMPGPSGGPTEVELEFGWAKPEWSALGLGRPPLPGDAPTSSAENLYIASEDFHNTGVVMNFESIEPNREIWIEDYNPEWTCISLRGTNFRVYRWAIHRCVAKDTTEGAWCNYNTGDCYIGEAYDGLPSYTWLGAGTTCQACTVKPVASLDFGNAPDPSYPTLLRNNGARHTIVPGIYLGARVDATTDGQPNAGASAADNDGVVFTSTIEPGKIASLTVTASVQGYLNAWIDFDGDGSFGGQSDQIFRDRLLSAGVNHLAFVVPDSAAEGTTYARFRFNTRGLLSYNGPATDGEVEDYRVTISVGFEPQTASGVTTALWDQPPSLVDPTDPYRFDGLSVPSSFGLQRVVADDCQFEDDRPVTGIHWWGSFEGWTQNYLPTTMPLAFHIGIWSDVPDPQPGNPNTFSHPGTLLWETYCVQWSWAVAGRQRTAKAGQTGPTCFQMSTALSQDEWFYPTGADGKSTEAAFFWVSIAAIYDLGETEPAHPWAWMSRAHKFGAAATVITKINPVDLSPWPPTPGAEWSQGTLVQDSAKRPLDMAFQLTSYQSPFSTGATTKASAAATDTSEKSDEETK